MEGKDFVAAVPSIYVEVTASRLTSEFTSGSMDKIPMGPSNLPRLPSLG